MKLKLELHRQHKIFLAFAGLLFAGSVAGSWLTWKQCNEREEEAKTLDGQVVDARKSVAGIDDLENDVIILRENVQSYVRILPSDAEVNDFYRMLDGFRREAGIQLTKFDPQLQRGKLDSSPSFDKAEYKLNFTATYAQFLQFIAKLENYERFVSIAQVKIAAGDREDKEQKAGADLVHKVELTLDTYVYLGDDLGKGVAINAYDKKKERLIEQIAEARQELELERFQLLAASGRRDPFVDPRARRGKNEPAGAALEEQRAKLSKVLAQIQECNALVDRMLNAGNVIRELELKMEAISKFAELQAVAEDVNGHGGLPDSALRKDWDKRVVPELARLKGRIGTDVTGGATPSTTRIRLQQALAAMEQHWDAGSYAECVRDWELVRGVGGGESADPELAEMQRKMERIYLSAQTAVEFGKKKLLVSGLVVEAGAESVAIINHTVFRAGEAVEDDLILLEIHEDHLVFEFKGVPLTLDL